MESCDAIVHPTATVDEGAILGAHTRIWHYAHVRSGAMIGASCVVGQGVYVDTGVSVGDRCKIQNGAHLYREAAIASGVFIGPGVILTNDSFPRAIAFDGRQIEDADWIARATTVHEGASIGAGTVVLPGLTIGPWAMIGARSLLTTSVPPHALAYGSPAQVVGSICRCTRIRGANLDELDCPCMV